VIGGGQYGMVAAGEVFDIRWRYEIGSEVGS
jgi:hypothetical protein